MPSTGFIKPTSIISTSGTVENENALLDTGDAKLTGNGATIVARYPDFNIPQNSTITAITVKLRVTPVAISTVALFRATPIITGATSVTSLQAIQQFFDSNDNSLVLDEALDFETTYNNFLNNPTINPIIQGLVTTPTNQGPAPESVLDINFSMSDPTDPVADVLTINCGALSPVVNIEYSIPASTKTIITNSTKVKLQPTSFNIIENVIGGPNAGGPPGDFNGTGTDMNFGTDEDNINKVLETPLTSFSSCAFLNYNEAGFKLFKFFVDEIPLDATITGVELIAGTDFDGSGNSRISSFGGNTGNFRMECRFHNGVNYSDRLTWDTSETYDGITFLNILGGTNNRASFSGASRHYKNNAAGDDVLFGGPNDLSGLTWDPVNQSSFGIGFAIINATGNASGGILRGIRMKVYYQITAFTHHKAIIRQGF